MTRPRVDRLLDHPVALIVFVVCLAVRTTEPVRRAEIRVAETRERLRRFWRFPTPDRSK